MMWKLISSRHRKLKVELKFQRGSVHVNIRLKESSPHVSKHSQLLCLTISEVENIPFSRLITTGDTAGGNISNGKRWITATCEADKGIAIRMFANINGNWKEKSKTYFTPKEIDFLNSIRSDILTKTQKYFKTEDKSIISDSMN